MTRVIELASLLNQSTAEDFEHSKVCSCSYHISKYNAEALRRNRCYSKRCAPLSGVCPEIESRRMYSMPFVNGPSLGSKKRVLRRLSDRSSFINDAMKERVKGRERRMRTTWMISLRPSVCSKLAQLFHRPTSRISGPTISQKNLPDRASAA